LFFKLIIRIRIAFTPQPFGIYLWMVAVLGILGVRGVVATAAGTYWPKFDVHDPGLDCTPMRSKREVILLTEGSNGRGS
jgi:hypothetical protein